eukprot:TRINITY_DN1998_c0_g2_i1.p1 TRINITY_DN1998_c0_g2~~TRINITY_DN1998_c0_g2_i1.p1  ORF type:complete len:340 (-),score=69.51 TRINITY_DN1998_c0_g2_i1:63-1082(-)
MEEKQLRLLNLARQYLSPFNLPYEVSEFIGSGAFATVWKAIHKETGMVVAIKIIEKNSKNIPFMDGERKVWEELEHPNIVKLIEVIDVADYLIFISEFFPSGNLYQVMKTLGRPFSSEETKKIFRQVLEAVFYMHQKGWAHRDLKLENILWDEVSETAKLLDFGLSIPAHVESRRFSGSPHYSPPEIFLHNTYDPVTADTWSLGVLLFAMLTFELPFEGQGEELANRVVYNGLSNERLFKVPQEEDQRLIMALLNKNCKSRPSIKELLNHTWLMDSKLGKPDSEVETPENEPQVVANEEQKVQIQTVKRKSSIDRLSFMQPFLKFLSSLEIFKSLKEKI